MTTTKRLLGALFILLLMVPASIAGATGQEVCGPLDSGKIDTSGEPATVTMTAPDGFFIDSYCIKAGSDVSVPEGAVQYIDVDPHAATITVPHPSGKAVSHYSFSYIEDPSSTTTTTSTTTVPPSTTSTTVPPTTIPGTTSTSTVPPVTTTTAPVSTSSSLPPTTTQPSSTQPTTTIRVAVTTPPVPPTNELPETGSAALWMALIASILLGSGLLARRAARGESSQA